MAVLLPEVVDTKNAGVVEVMVVLVEKGHEMALLLEGMH